MTISRREQKETQENTEKENHNTTDGTPCRHRGM
jgi:hypothetical protein